MREHDSNSLYPALRKVASNPTVKWVAGIVATAIVTAVTTGFWPFFKGWVVTRASTEEVASVSKRVDDLEATHNVSIERLGKADDDASGLTDGERLRWSVIRIKRLRMQLVQETRARACMEARLRMPKPNSDSARGIAAAVGREFDDLMLKGEEPQTAAHKALESVYGKD